jgi:hypothetical protein
MNSIYQTTIEEYVKQKTKRSRDAKEYYCPYF